MTSLTEDRFDESTPVDTENKKQRLRVEFIEAPDPEAAMAFASAATRPSVQSASVVKNYSANLLKQDLNMAALTALLSESMKDINDGSMKLPEAMLYGQAQALQAIFTNMANIAAEQTNLPHIETFLKLAFKAQSQCSRTLEVLGAIKSPSVVFTKQANISHGHQQVNNGVSNNLPAHAETELQSNELMEVVNGERMDTGTKDAPSGTNTSMETMGKSQGPDDRAR